MERKVLIRIRFILIATLCVLVFTGCPSIPREEQIRIEKEGEEILTTGNRGRFSVPDLGTENRPLFPFLNDLGTENRPLFPFDRDSRGGFDVSSFFTKKFIWGFKTIADLV